MFSKKTQADVKKSTQKFLDFKKDQSTRLKHLRIISDHVEGEEATTFFETNSRLIYYFICDCIQTAENNFKQRVHKAHREELDSTLVILEKLLLHLPELLGKGWQLQSLLRTLSKLLHPGNSWKLRRDAIRYFIIWYQALGENAPNEVDAVFATLVPGFTSPFTGLGLPPMPVPPSKGSSTGTVFHDNNSGDILPVLPPQSGEKPLEEPTKFFLDVLLDTIVSQVTRVEWKEKLVKQHSCFSFLLERFKLFYLPYIFPSWSNKTSIYQLNLDLPEVRKCHYGAGGDAECKDPMLSCRVVIIKWIAGYTHLPKKDVTSGNLHSTSVTPETESSGSELRRVSVGQLASVTSPTQDTMIPPSLPVLMETDMSQSDNIVRDVLYSSRDNVCFVLEVYRQAFLLPFSHAHAIRRAIAVYKDWIQMNVSELPPFMLEPIEPLDIDQEGRPRLRNDSYIGAIHRDHLFVRAGLQNTLQIFVTHAANVFMLQVRTPTLLEEQVDTCKRVLNIYRHMVMNIRMEPRTWEQLLSVLLQVTALVLTRTPPKRKEDTLGGKLAPAIFQTLIVTWIKANLNVVISSALWDQFLSVLSSLTQWEELIREWAKTLETLTRVLARNVYDLDLYDLPLDRLSEQQAKKRRGIRGNPGGDVPRILGRRDGTRMSKNLNNSMQESCSTPDASGSFQFCAARKRLDSSGEYSLNTSSCLSRSCSEGNLTSSSSSSKRHRHRHRTQRSIQTISHTVVIPVLPASVETEVARLLRGGSPRVTFSSVRQSWRRRCRSLDSVRHDESPVVTRSPSPAPSSNVETSSIKDSPMPLDFMTGDNPSIDSTDHHTGGRSVMAGGSVRGWLPDVAVVLWKRMLGALGDINRLPDPALHAHVFEYLVDLWDTLAKIKANQGVPEEGATPPPSVLTPPMVMLAPWCFKALELPDSYQRGKLSAYRLLCKMALAAGPSPFPPNQLTHLYRCLHFGLAGPHPIVVSTLVKSLGPGFLCRQLPGYSLLLLDLISASNSVLDSVDLQYSPRIEAASILGSLVSLPYMVSQAPALDPRSPSLSVLNCAGAKDLVIGSLLRCAKKEQTGVARCTALSALAVFAFTELAGSSTSPHPAVRDAFDVILLGLKFKQREVALVCCDLLFTLSDLAHSVLQRFPEIPAKIVRVLSHTLAVLGPGCGQLGQALALTLGEWVMRLPVPLLLVHRAPQSLLLTILTVLSNIANGVPVNEEIALDFPEELLHEWENSCKLNDIKSPKVGSDNDKAKTSLACRAVLIHLVSHLGHFPMGLGAARLSALVQEHDDVPALGNDLSTRLLSAPNIQLFLYRNSLMSLVEVETLAAPGGGVTAGLCTAPAQTRVLLRDLASKSSWDASILYCSPQDLPSCRKLPRLPQQHRKFSRIGEDAPLSMMVGSIPPRGTLRHRSPNVLPSVSNAAPDMDNLHDLLRYIGYSSPECLEDADEDLSEPGLTPVPLTRQAEAEVIYSVLAQRTSEADYAQYSELTEICTTPVHENTRAPFQYCRRLFSQLGFNGWERRSQIQLLSRTERLLRELRNLDTQRGRESHKIAVIYVAAGQEDKNSILSNKGGSQAYEQFVAGLAWEVELASHTGFLGGLGSGCGDTAPYYATAFVETLFHVATRMPSDSEEALLQKMRHLGNDEVHIVWSEHTRDYRRSSLPTEFCDILIVVYPLPDSLYRVTVDTKTEIPLFGPLWNEAIVEGRALAGLVRSAALCASRAKRRTLSHYQNFYEERARSLASVTSVHKDPKSFEDFTAAVFTPVAPSNPIRPTTAPLAKALLDHHPTKPNHPSVWDKISPQPPKKQLVYKPDTESPVFLRQK